MIYIGVPRARSNLYAASGFWAYAFSSSVSSGDGRIGSPTNCDRTLHRRRPRSNAGALLAAGDAPKGSSNAVFLLDLIFVAIGIAAFAITALYLGACDTL